MSDNDDDDTVAVVPQATSPAGQAEYDLPTVHPAAESETSDGARGAVFLCAACRHPIVDGCHVYRTQATSAARNEVYSYEVELLDGLPPIWAYSATNPHGDRFDLIRISPYVTAEQARSELAAPDETNGYDLSSLERRTTQRCMVDFGRSYSDEQSFFTGYDWCMCTCAHCRQFLGWGFAPHTAVCAATGSVSLSSSTITHITTSTETESSNSRSMSGGGSGDGSSGEEEAEEDDDDSVVQGGGEYEIHYTQPRETSARRSTSRGSHSSHHDGVPASESLHVEEGGVGNEGMAALRETRRGRVDPMPEFVGLIVTRCTGESSYPLAMYERAVEALPYTRRRARLVGRYERYLCAHYYFLQRSNRLSSVNFVFDYCLNESNLDWTRGAATVRVRVENERRLRLLRHRLRRLCYAACSTSLPDVPQLSAWSTHNAVAYFLNYRRRHQASTPTAVASASLAAAMEPPDNVLDEDRQSGGCSSTDEQEEDEEEEETSGYDGEFREGESM